MTNIENKKRALIIGLTHCTSDNLEKFKFIEKNYLNSEDLNYLFDHKYSFLYYSLKNLSKNVVSYLLDNNCSLSNEQFRDLIRNIPSKKIPDLYDLLNQHNLISDYIFEIMVYKLYNRNMISQLISIFEKRYNNFNYTLLNNVLLKKFNLTIKDKHKFFFRQLILEELTEDN